MLPKPYRITLNRDFKKVSQKGSKIRGNFLLFRWLKNEFKTSRFGFVISNKISKKSTVRHKIARRLKEAVGARVPVIKPGYDCVFLVMPGAKEKKYREIDNAVEGLFRKAGLLI